MYKYKEIKWHKLIKKSISVLMDNLSFSNGLILSPKEDYLLVLESGRQRIWKYHLVGKKKGQSEVFADMPGVPDNITPNGDDGYFVGIVFPSTSKLDDVIKQLRSFHPIVRLLVRLLKLIHLLIEFIHDYIFQTEMTEMLGTHYIKICIKICNIIIHSYYICNPCSYLFL